MDTSRGRTIVVSATSGWQRPEQGNGQARDRQADRVPGGARLQQLRHPARPGADDQVVSAALDAGIDFFDTAGVYGGTRSEALLRKALGARRAAVVVATKFGIPIDEARPGGARPEYIRRAAEDSLRRLGADYIDLYQLHRPDPEVPIADTLGALGDLVAAGKVREIGCSNFSAEQLYEAASAIRAGAPAFASVQNEYSLLERGPERGVRCQQ